MGTANWRRATALCSGAGAVAEAATRNKIRDYARMVQHADDGEDCSRARHAGRAPRFCADASSWCRTFRHHPHRTHGKPSGRRFGRLRKICTSARAGARRMIGQSMRLRFWRRSAAAGAAPVGHRRRPARVWLLAVVRPSELASSSWSGGRSAAAHGRGGSRWHEQRAAEAVAPDGSLGFESRWLA